MGKAYRKKLDVNKAATAAGAGRKGKGAGGGNAKRSGGAAGAGGAGPGGGAKGAGGAGWGGASTFSATYHTPPRVSPQVMGKKKDHYEILGVLKAATAGDINEAYHKRSALKWKEAERGFERLTTAYKVLNDPLRRPLYDTHLRAEEKLMGKAPPPPAASSGVALGRVVRTGRKRAALGTGGRQNTDRTGGGTKGAGLGSTKGKAGGNGKRPRCPADRATCAGPGGAGLGGTTGAHASTTFFSTGRSTFEMSVKYTNEYYNEENCSSFDGEPFCPTDYSTFKTAVKYTNEYYNEENCSSFNGEPFGPTDHSTFKTAVKAMNEYYDEDENLGLCMCEDGGEEEGVQDDYGDHAGAGNDDTRICDGLFNGDCTGGDHNYGDHGGAGNNDDTGVCDDYYDTTGGFDDGYYDGDGGDAADNWW